ncbi:phospholipid carrier-dependent glycosyltransferase [Candidatus Microgenomates bacterium]|nr:MAG: phospholipid carrier-dependent glycosyltransferase [Candidatus Microgenomates bacterium]
MRNKTIFLLFILLLGFFLRFYRLGDVPAGLHRDEAFLGYNAFSILKTGGDINGNLLPLHLQSFLFSPAGYSYFSIPFIKIFDLSSFSVRFASALFGSLTVILVFFITKELFSKRLRESKKININMLASTSALLLAISPWHINLSRTATENTIVVFFISLGLLFYLFWLRKKGFIFLQLSFFSFGLTFLLYQAPRVFLPFFIPLMVFFLSKEIFKKREVITLICHFLLTTILPLILILSSKDLSLRIRTVSLFSTDYTNLVIEEQIREDGVSDSPRIITRIFHNKPLGYFSQFTQNYFKHFSYDFLFSSGGFPDRYRVPLSGLIYLFEIPFLLLGGIFLFNKERKIGAFLLTWVALAPIGSSLAFDDVPNLQRTLIIFPALSIISAYGVYNFLSLFTNLIYKKIFIVSASIILFFNVFFYLHQYYIHLNLYRPWFRNDGYKELVKKVNDFLPVYKKAVITNHESAPTIFFLFYSRYNPSLFQKETKNTLMKDFDRVGFGPYEFSQEECPLREISGKEKGLIDSTDKRDIIYVNGGLCKEIYSSKTLSVINRGDHSRVFNIASLK